jgi:hypothetical protein
LADEGWVSVREPLRLIFREQTRQLMMDGGPGESEWDVVETSTQGGVYEGLYTAQ